MPSSEPCDGTVEDRLERLRPEVKLVHCEDDAQHRTELRKRIVSGGGIHYVQQCLRCGEQVGSPAKRSKAAPEPEAFDLALVARHDEIMSLRAALLREQATQWAAPDPGGYEAPHAARARIADAVDELLSGTSDQIGKAAALQLFRQRVWALEAEIRADLAAATDRFGSELELSAWLRKHLSEDFVLHEEVRGRHLGENIGVRIDFVAYPKPHLIAEGFEAGPFGIEVKFIDPFNGFTRKASRMFWQAVTYTDSEFFVGEEKVRLKFAMVFSNLSFEAEYKLLKADDREQWHAFVNLAHHSRVARLAVKGDRNRCDGWTVMLSSNAYFYRKSEYRTGKPIYQRTRNTSLREIQRVGSF